MLVLAQEEVANVGLPWPLVAAGVLAILGIAGYVVRGVRSLRTALTTWVQDQAQAVQAVADQVTTSNGHKLGELVESTAAEVSGLKGEISVLTEWATENREMAKSATSGVASLGHRVATVEARQDSLEHRLARHEVEGHKT